MNEYASKDTLLKKEYTNEFKKFTKRGNNTTRLT